MSEYGQTGQKRAPLLSNNYVQERKTARRKIIEAAEWRRSEIYKRYREKKRRLQVNGDLI